MTGDSYDNLGLPVALPVAQQEPPSPTWSHQPMSQGLEQVSQNRSTKGVRRSALELPPSSMSSSRSSLAAALLCRELRLEEGASAPHLPEVGEGHGEGRGEGEGSTTSTTPMLSEDEDEEETGWHRPEGRRWRWW